MRMNDIQNGFNPNEIKQKFDGWELYKKNKTQSTMIHRYCSALDEDYMKNKITIVAHINHIYDLYLHQRRPFMHTYADVCDRHLNRQGSAHSRKINYQSQTRATVSQVAFGINTNNNSIANQLCVKQNATNGGQASNSGSNCQSIKNQNSLNRANKQSCSKQTSNRCKSTEQTTNENNSTADSDFNKIGVMNPDACNQILQSLNYYVRQSAGIIYQNNKEDKNLEYYYQVGLNDYLFDVRTLTKPIRKVYINFDKDIANKMFGYRIRFLHKDMQLYAKTGTPSCFANQCHKPIHFYQKEKIKNIVQRYSKFKNYHSRQTIVKVLDSDNEEDQVEIEKNRKIISKLKQPVNANPKIKKFQKRLDWCFGLDPKWEQRTPSPSEFNNPQSIQYWKRTRFPHQKRFQSNFLRFSQKIYNNNQQYQILKPGIHDQMSQQVLQLHKHAASDTTSCPQSEKKVTSGSNLLLDKLSYHNLKDKLIHSDQKAKPDSEQMDSRADLSLEVKQNGNSFFEYQPETVAQNQQEYKYHSQITNQCDQISINYDAISKLQKQLQKHDKSSNNNLVLSSNQTHQIQSEYSNNSKQYINQTLDQLELQKNKLKHQISIQNQQSLRENLDGITSQVTILKQVDSDAIQIDDQNAGCNVNDQLEADKQQSQANSTVDGGPKFNDQIFEEVSQQSVNIQNDQNDINQSFSRYKQQIGIVDFDQQQQLSQNCYDWSANNQNMIQMRLQAKYQSIQNYNELNKFDQLTNNRINLKNEFDNNDTNIGQGLQASSNDNCSTQQDYIQTMIQKETPNTKYFSEASNFSSSIRIQSGARCLNNSNLITTEESNLFNVQILNDQQPTQTKQNDRNNLFEQQPFSQNKLDSQAATFDFQNSTQSSGCQNDSSKNKKNCKQVANFQSSLISQNFPSKPKCMQGSSTRLKLFSGQSVRMRQGSSQIDIEFKPQWQPNYQNKQDNISSHHPKAIKSTRPISKRKRQSTLNKFSRASLHHPVISSNFQRQSKASENCSCITINQNNNQQLHTCSIQHHRDQFLPHGSISQNNMHNGSLVFQTQQVVDKDNNNEAGFSLSKKLQLKTDKETLFGPSGQHQIEDYDGSDCNLFDAAKNVNMLCQPHSASSIIQKNGAADISPVIVSDGTANPMRAPKLTINTTAESHYLIKQIQQNSSQLVPNHQNNNKQFKLQPDQQSGVALNQIQFSAMRQPAYKNNIAVSSPCTSRKIKVTGTVLNQEQDKQDKKRQSTFTCYNNNQVEAVRNFMQNEQHFGSSLSSSVHGHGKNSLNVGYRLQGNLLLNEQGCDGRLQTHLLNDYSHQRAAHPHQIKLDPHQNNYCPGNFLLQSVDLNINGKVQSPHVSAINLSNLQIKNNHECQNQSKLQQLNLEEAPQMTNNVSDIAGSVSNLNQYCEVSNSKTSQQKESKPRKTNSIASSSRDINPQSSLLNSCSRRDKQIINTEQHLIDYCQQSQISFQRKPQVPLQINHIRNSTYVLGSILDKRESSDNNFAANGRDKHQTEFDALTNGTKIQSFEQQNQLNQSKVRDQYCASTKSTTNQTLLQRTSSISSQKNKCESVTVTGVDDNFRLQQPNKSSGLNHQQNTQNKEQGNQLENDFVHLSGEQTLKKQNYTYEHVDNADQNQNSKLIKAINNNLQLQQKCIEIFENNQQLLSQLNHYGKSQRSDLNSESHNRKQSQLTVGSHHDSTAASINNGITKQKAIDQICYEKYSKNQSNEEHATRAATFNKRSQEELLSQQRIKNRKVVNFKQKNHQKFMSLGQGILYPKSYIDQAASHLDETSKINESIKDDSIVGSSGADQRQNSVLFPDFLDRNCTQEKLPLPISTSSSKYQGLKNKIGTANYHHSLERNQRKISGVQNNIASMNGQIILNLNQSLFRNMNQQLLNKQLNLNGTNQEQNLLIKGSNNQPPGDGINDQRSFRASPRKIRAEGLHGTQRLTSSLQNCESRQLDGPRVFQDITETNSTKVIRQLQNYELQKDH